MWLCLLGAACSSPGGTEHAGAAASGQAPPPSTVINVVAPEDGPPIGLVASGPVCDGTAYLPDPRNGVVHVISLDDGQRRLVIGGRSAAGGLRAPEAVAARCDTSELYVLDAQQVYQYNAASGELISSVPRPENVGMGTGGPGVATAEDIVFPALWLPHREALRENAEAELLRGARLGYVQQDGSARSLLPIVTEQCRNATPCGRVGLDRVRLSAREGAIAADGWMACQGAGRVVGLFDDAGAPIRQIDVRSPAFLDDGTSVGATEPIPEKMKWLQRNSVVMWCGGFGDVVAVVHSSLENRDWQQGMALAPRPFMNLYRTDGAVVKVDVPLSDLPIAKDRHALYVLNYGNSRSTNGGHRLSMQQIAILESTGELSDWLTRTQ